MVYNLSLRTEKQIKKMWNWVHVFTIESKINWVFAVLKWVFMNFFG